MISKLAQYTSLSPNNSGIRLYPVSRITPHIVVGQFDADVVASWFNKPERKASANYIIGKSGEILCNCLEENRAWTSGNADNDNKAITIECACDLKSPYALNNAVYTALIDLCVDICRRYNKSKLMYFSDKEKALSYCLGVDEMLLTKHAFFQNVSCWGKWFDDNVNDFVNRVNTKLSQPTDANKLYHVQVGAFMYKENAVRLCNELKQKGYVDAFIKED